MGLIVKTDNRPVTVYTQERQTQNGGKFTTYALGVASKDSEGNWVNGFIDCNFKKTDAEKIVNKCKINITNSFYTVSEYNGRKYVKLFVLSFEVVESPKPAPAPIPSDGDDWMKIPEGIDEELPFS